MFTQHAARKIDLSLFLIWIYFILRETIYIDWHEYGWECEKITLKMVKVKVEDKKVKFVILSVNKALFLLGNLI